MSRGAFAYFGVLSLGVVLTLGYVSLRGGERSACDNQLRIGVLCLDRSSWSLLRFGIGETLVVVGFDVAREPAPGLATSWQRIGARRWRFRLREDVRFHDGTPLSADIVTRILSGCFEGRFATEAPVAELRAEKSGAMSVDVVTAHPGISAPCCLGRLLILKPESFTESGFSERLVGTGPWKVERIRYGDRLELSRNSDYWGGAPRLERLVVRQIGDHQTRVLALESGDLDWSQMILRQDIARLADAGYPVIRSDFFYDVFIHFNTERAPVDDARVRQAISFAIDREKIAAGPFEGTAVAASSLYPPEVAFFAPGQQSYAYDPDRARALLDEAGWKLRGDSGVRMKEGRSLVLNLLSRSNRPAHMQAGEIIQQELSEVGIRCEYEVVEFGAWEARVNGRRGFVASLDGRLPSWMPDPVGFIQNEFTSMGSAHTCGLRDARLERVVRRAMDEVDEGPRIALIREMQGILAEQQPWVILVHDLGRETFATAKGLAPVETPFTRMFAFPGPLTRWSGREE
ncbi:MAG: ABC transporter substrate-binding protein [Planctomycetota bacterium]